MMTQRLADAVREQVNAELYSAYLYLAMSAWSEHEGWKGMGRWLRVQAQEEQVHALVLHDQLLERGERAMLTLVSAPPQSWSDPLAMFQHVYEHEREVTRLINSLATIAMEDRDHAFYQFIQMFVREQVEEESAASDLCTRLGRIAGQNAMIDALDKELGARLFTPPFPGYAT